MFDPPSYRDWRDVHSPQPGVRALPEASSVKVKAEQVWNLIPKREILLAVGKAIEAGAASNTPLIESIGFRFPLGQLAWDYQVVLALQGRRYAVTLQVRPDNIGSLGVEAGKALAKVLCSFLHPTRV